MLDLESYLVEFDFKRNIKDKVYPDNYQFGDICCKPKIMITHNGYIFFAIDRITYGWQYKRDIFFYSKKKRRGIIILDFLLLYFQLNSFQLLEEKQD